MMPVSGVVARMPISGLIVTLSDSDASARDAIDWLRSDARFEVGEFALEGDRRVPLVADTPDSDGDEGSWADLQQHAGIEFVDVVCVFFS